MAIPRDDRPRAAQRIRHALPAVGWPSREEAAPSRLPAAIAIGRGLMAADRTWVPAMVPRRASCPCTGEPGPPWRPPGALGGSC